MRYLAHSLLAFSLISSVAHAQRPAVVIVAHATDKDGRTITLYSNANFETEAECKAVVDNPSRALLVSVLGLAQRLASEGKQFVDIACEAPKEPV